jgi:DNA-binding transcriptional LysR family regulator
MTSALALRMAATFRVESELHHRAGSECRTSIMPARNAGMKRPASQGARERDPAVARRSIVGEDLERGTLKRLFRIAVPSRESYWFVSPKQLAQAPKVKAFRDWVKAELGVAKAG